MNESKVVVPMWDARRYRQRPHALCHDFGWSPPVPALVVLCSKTTAPHAKFILNPQLLGAGADPNLEMSTHMDPLAAVILGGTTKTSPTLGPPLIRALVAAGADINAVRSPRGFAPLHLACFEGACGEVVQALLDAGADACMPCAGSMQGAGIPFMSPLQLAGARGNVEAVSVLIGHPACRGFNAVGASPFRLVLFVG